MQHKKTVIHRQRLMAKRDSKYQRKEIKGAGTVLDILTFLETPETAIDNTTKFRII